MSLARKTLVVCSLILVAGCWPAYHARYSLWFDEAQGLSVIDSAVTPDVGFRRPSGGPQYVPSRYALERGGFRMEFVTKSDRSAGPSLWIYEAFTDYGDSLALEGPGIGKGHRGTGVAYYVLLAELLDTLRLTIRSASGAELGRAELTFQLIKHSARWEMDHVELP